MLAGVLRPSPSAELAWTRLLARGISWWLAAASFACAFD